jgi:hypothetical protein
MVKEVMTLSDGSTGSFLGQIQRRNTITSEEWVGIQGTVAVDYVGSHATDSDVEDISAEIANDAGAYSIRKETIALGTWY